MEIGRARWVAPTVIACVAAISVALTAFIMRGGGSEAPAQLRESSPTTTFQAVPPSPAIALSTAPVAELHVSGHLFVPSRSATVEKGAFGIKTCSGGSDAQKAEAEIARLSFSADKDGNQVIGATGASGPARLVLSTVRGKPTCAWQVEFSTMLPEEIADARQRRYNGTVVWMRKPQTDLMIMRVKSDFPRPPHRAGQYCSLGLGNWEPRTPGCQSEDLKPADESKLVRRAYSISNSILDDAGNLLDVAATDYLEFYITLVREGSDPAFAATAWPAGVLPEASS